MPHEGVYNIKARFLQSESSVVDEVWLAEKHEECAWYQAMV